MSEGNSFARGPYFLAALLCEKVLNEADGVKSVIRIIDRVTRTVIGPDPPAEMEPFDYDLNLFARFKSGETGRGGYKLKLSVEKPSKEITRVGDQTIFFEGEEDRGVDVIVSVRIKFEMQGIYWFHLYLNDVPLTKVPLRVLYLPQATQPGTFPPIR